MIDIQIKRVYEPASSNDGFRILVDRLWPRGMTKEKLQAELWLKDAAPSNDLRNWYHHDLSKRDEFKARYFSELDANPEPVRILLDYANKGKLTLLFAARDAEHNQAVVLREYLLMRILK